MATTSTTAPRLFTRADALAILKIGETTLFWLQRTGKLNPIRIGSRVLFSAAEIERIAVRGASLTTAEKDAATRRDRLALTIPQTDASSPSPLTTTWKQDRGRRRARANATKTSETTAA
jgi:hypothetical protein